MNLTGVVLKQEGGFQVVFEYFPVTPYTWLVGIGDYAMKKATDMKTMIEASSNTTLTMKANSSSHGSCLL